jgi:hypothetical protein
LPHNTFSTCTRSVEHISGAFHTKRTFETLIESIYLVEIERSSTLAAGAKQARCQTLGHW